MMRSSVAEGAEVHQDPRRMGEGSPGPHGGEMMMCSSIAEGAEVHQDPRRTS